MKGCNCHTCLAVRYVRTWARNIRKALAAAPRDHRGKASAFDPVGLAEANGMNLEDNAILLEEVADQLELDRHLPKRAAAMKHDHKPQIDSRKPLCSFCGAPAKKSQEHPRNTEQLVHTCKSPDCLNAFRAILEGVPADTRALDKSKKPRQRKR